MVKQKLSSEAKNNPSGKNISNASKYRMHLTFGAAIFCALAVTVAVFLISTAATTQYVVSTSSDDADERTSNGQMDTNNDDLRFGDDSYSRHVGIRFQNVTIPSGATITSAKIRLRSGAGDTGSFTGTFYGEDTATPGTFSSSAHNISNRTRTTAGVSAGSGQFGDWVNNNYYDSPDLTSIVQELTGSYDYSSGRNMAFLWIYGSGNGERIADAYDRSGDYQPELIIEYEVAQVDNNPDLPESCGFDIALVLDSSDSLDNGELQDVRDSANAFVDSLSGTPTKVAVVDFDTSIISSLALTDITDSAVTSAINSIGHTNAIEYTNWEAGILKGQELLAAGSSEKPNLLVIITDGDPTRSTSPGDVLLNAVNAANAAKTAGTRILAIGVSNSPTIANLKAISGPDVDTGDLTTDVITSDFDELLNDLADFAVQLCGGTITVNKYINSVAPENRAGEGWEFNIAGTTKLTDSNGQTDSVEVDEGDGYSVIENSVPAGYAFLSASCENQDNAEVGSSTQMGVDNISIGSDDIISCDFVNEKLCGNNELNDGEQCDDGNNDNGDGCDEFCQEEEVEGYCGDGNLDEGEECDDGNTENGDGCSKQCKSEDDKKIYLCHATGSEQNPWVLVDVDRSSTDYNGHDDHEDDIIPVLDYNGDNEIDEADCALADGECHDITINYGGLYHGDFVAEQYASVGAHLSAVANAGRPNQLIIFDTNQINTPDPDLEAAIGNAGIIPENVIDTLPADNLVDSPNDSAEGGQQIFMFDHARDIESFIFIDKDNDNPATATAYDENDNVIEQVNIPNAGDGSVQTINMTAAGVYKLVIEYEDSGAVTGMKLHCTPPYEENADLGIEKSDDVDPVVAGAQLVYTIGITNYGPDDSTGYSFEDTLPAGVTFVSADTTSGSCLEAAGVVTCDMNGLTVGPTAEVTVTVDVGSDYTERSLTNHVELTTRNQVDPNAQNDEDDEETQVTIETDLSVTKTDSIDPAVAGEDDITYTIEVTNNGASDSTGYTLTDTLPADVTFVSADPDSPVCEHDAGVVTCDMDSLLAGETDTIYITVHVDAQAHESITNEVTVDPEEYDSNEDNNTDTEDTAIGKETDLGIEIDDSPDPIEAGGTLTYTLNIDNNGPSDVIGYQVTQDLPAEVTYVSGVPADAGSCSEAAGVVTCYLFNLNSGDTTTVTVTVTVNAGTAGGTLLHTEADVSSSAIDSNSANNHDEEDTLVVYTDLFIVKDDETDPIIAGDTEIYYLRIFNDGPYDSTGYTVEDTLPAGVTFVSATSDDGSCSEDSGIVTCEMDGLEVQGEAVIEVTVTVDEETRGTITNSAEITETNEDDLDTEDNYGEEDTWVIGPEIGSSKVEDDEDNIVRRSDIVTFTITLVNNGESTAYNVNVYDILDSHLIDLQDVTVQGCGEYTDNSTSNPAILDIQGMTLYSSYFQQADDDSGPNEPQECVITFKAKVNPSSQNGDIIPNEATVSYDGGPDQHPASDDLTVKTGSTPTPGPQCGNGQVESGEQCDDGNRQNGDGCDEVCKNEPAPEPEPELKLVPEETCLLYNPDREILYTDNLDIWTKDYVDFLSRIYLTDKDQYIISGDGSFYGSHDATDDSTIRPIDYTNRFETAKIALTSFCIPIYSDEERLAAGELEGARPDFPDLPRAVDQNNPYINGEKMSLDPEILNFVEDVFYKAYDEGILDGRLKPNGESLAEWDQPITRAEILKIFVNAADYDPRNSFMYTEEELQEFADYIGTTVEALTPNQILNAAIYKWRDYYYDAKPNAWYTNYIPMVVKNQIVADVCMPKDVALDNGFDNYAPAQENDIRTIAAAYDCKDLEDPARFTFADNPAVRGEVFALDARMLFITAATDFVNSHSGRNMRNQTLLDVLFTDLKDNERSEFLFAIQFLLGLLS